MRTPLSMASPAPTIIVIEDETSMRRLLKTILAAQGYLVVEAETGQRGLVEAGTRKPDLVILDLGLPDMDGAQVIKGLREWSQIPIVVLSARDQESQPDETLRGGGAPRPRARRPAPCREGRRECRGERVLRRSAQGRLAEPQGLGGRP